MAIDWVEVNRTLSPIKDYEDLCRRFRDSFRYSFAQEVFNYSMPELAAYTHKLLGGDTRGRYNEYSRRLIDIFDELNLAGVGNLLELKERTATREKLENFVEQSGVEAEDVIFGMKYLVYWFIPGEKYLSGLVRDDPIAEETMRVLGSIGVRTNLELLQKASTPQGRKALTELSGLDEESILAMVNRADLSRMPWASKATVSNILGAGYGSIARLANAEPEKLYADFYAYGKAIGKNLKSGNEIESSHRIAKIVPRLVQED